MRHIEEIKRVNKVATARTETAADKQARDDYYSEMDRRKNRRFVRNRKTGFLMEAAGR